MKYSKMFRYLAICVGFAFSVNAVANDLVASESKSINGIYWQPNINSTTVLEVTNGFGFSLQQVFKDNNPSFSVTQDGNRLSDGIYTYKLTGFNAEGSTIRQSGGFEVLDGSILISNEPTDEQ